MKFILFFVLTMTATLVSLGQKKGEFVEGKPGMYPSFVSFPPESAPGFTKGKILFTDVQAKVIASAPASVTIQAGYEKDASGDEHYRYQQKINGIPVEHAIYIVHTRDNKVFAQNGKWIKDVPSSLPAASLKEPAALAYALQSVNARSYIWENPDEEAFIKRKQNNPAATYYPKAKLVYYSGEEDVVPSSLRPAYKFYIYASDPISNQAIFVDAVNGMILGKRELLFKDNVVGTAVTGYSGNQSIITDYTGSIYRLQETGRGSGIETFNMRNGTDRNVAVDFTDADNTWNNVNSNLDQYATDAHWGAEQAYDYYKSKFGRNSIDNLGHKITSYVHYGLNYHNAAWITFLDGVAYGDGDGKPHTTLDICGHEITHGLTEYTSHLNYSNESGALHEGFSDIFGTAIEFYARGTSGNWLLGEDLGSPLRNLANPNQFGCPDTYLGNNWHAFSDHPDEGNDWGGVHFNSGILDYWFYLLSVGGSGTNDKRTAFNVTGIGIDKAAAIAYRTNTIYLVSTSQYTDAKFFSIRAAMDLYGYGSAEVAQTINAWIAVGLAEPVGWTQRADYGGGARLAAAGFSIGNKGYMGTGIADGIKKDFWQYNPSTNVWTQKEDFKGTARRYATGFSIGLKGYLGTGIDISGIHTKDFWEYDTTANEWTQIDDVPGLGRATAVSFSIGNKGYVGTGTGFKDFYEYDPVSGHWRSRANFGGGGRTGAVGFSIGNRGYIGTGSGAGTVFKNDFWEYNPETDAWIRKSDFGGSARRNATGFSIGNRGYIGTGDDNTGIYKNDFWEYDPCANTWAKRANFGGGGRYLATGFSIGGTGYIGTGPYAGDFWEYTPVIPVPPDTWVKVADYGGGGRVAAAGFSIGNMGYMGTGIADGIKKDFWQYNPSRDEWTQKEDFKGTARRYATGFSIGPKGYMGTGIDISGIHTKDFWEYDTTANEWRQIDDVPGLGRATAVSFSIDNKGYVGTGTGFNDFYEYDPVSGHWRSRANFGGGGRTGAVGFSIGNKGYIGTGSGAGTVFKNDFWEYNPQTDAWTRKADFGGSARRNATGFSIGSRGYIGTGSENTGMNTNDFWEYEPGADTWTQRAHFGGGGRYLAAGFSTGTKGYIGTGPYAGDFWEYTPLVYNTITTRVASTVLCTGSAVEVEFTSSSNCGYNERNYFFAQISDSTGDFTNSISIGTSWGGVSSGKISTFIPVDIPPGHGYRIRVVSADPSVTGFDNGTNLTIKVTPELTNIPSYPTVCNNAVFNYTPAASLAGTTYSWSRAQVTGISNPADSSAPGNTAGVINEKLTNTDRGPVKVWYDYKLNNDGCINITPYKVVVLVKPSPLVQTKNITVYLDANGAAAITPNMIDNGSVSYCGARTLIYKLDKTIFSCADLGDNNVKLTVTDCIGNASTGTAVVRIQDNLPPAIINANVTPANLCPPNGEMRDVLVDYTVSDNCSVPNSCISVTSNEPPGTIAPDWIIQDSHHLLLRSERSENFTGRTYTITITAKDAVNNTSSELLTVTVPYYSAKMANAKSFGNAKSAIDGKAYNGLNVQVMPNPSQHLFNIIMRSNSIVPITVKVTDVAGRVIEIWRNVPANSSLQLGQEYRTGTYFVQLIQADNKTTVTLFKKAD